MPPRLRGAVLLLAPLLMLLGIWDLGRRIEASFLSPVECYEDLDACRGQVLELGYLAVRAVHGDEVEAWGSGRRLILVGLGPEGRRLRPGASEISVAATWIRGERFAVHRSIVHPHRFWKKVIGLGVVGGWALWLGGLGLRRRRG